PGFGQPSPYQPNAPYQPQPQQPSPVYGGYPGQSPPMQSPYGQPAPSPGYAGGYPGQQNQYEMQQKPSYAHPDGGQMPSAQGYGPQQGQWQGQNQQQGQGQQGDATQQMEKDFLNKYAASSEELAAIERWLYSGGVVRIRLMFTIYSSDIKISSNYETQTENV
ncbi:MAG: hypothetical protein Q9159_007265, partial [Coniocarpon cinnabarinum]